MQHEGMVHALQEIRRLLKLDGVLVNILPAPEGEFIELHHAGRVLFSQPKRASLSENVLAAEAAVQQVLNRGLFVMDRQDEFEFRTYGSSVPEVRAYWDAQSAFNEVPKEKERLAREESIYAQVERLLDELGSGAQIVFRERVRMARLSPLQG